MIAAVEAHVGRDRRDEWQRRKRVERRLIRRARRELIRVLGGECVECGGTQDLQFDHTDGRDWHLRKRNRLQRLRLHWRDAERGLVRLLCRPCNSYDGRWRQIEGRYKDKN